MSEAITTLPSTEWKNVKSYPGYAVSSRGDVRKKNSNELMKLFNSHGYYIAQLYKDGKPHRTRVHRLVAEAFLGDCPQKGWQINHKNSKTTDNTVENLEWVDPKQNMRHYHEQLRKNGQIPKKQRVGIQNIETQEIQVFDSMGEAAAFFGIKKSTMCSNAIDYHNSNRVYKNKWFIYKLNDNYEICDTAYPTKLI